MSEEAIILPIRSRKHDDSIILPRTVVRAIVDELSQRTLDKILGNINDITTDADSVVGAINEVKHDIGTFTNREDLVFVEESDEPSVPVLVNPTVTKGIVNITPYNDNFIMEYFLEDISSNLVSLHVNIRLSEGQRENSASTIFSLSNIKSIQPLTSVAYMYSDNTIVNAVLVDIFPSSADSDDHTMCCFTDKTIDLSCYTGMILSCIIKK